MYFHCDKIQLAIKYDNLKRKRRNGLSGVDRSNPSLSTSTGSSSSAKYKLKSPKGHPYCLATNKTTECSKVW